MKQADPIGHVNWKSRLRRRLHHLLFVLTSFSPSVIFPVINQQPSACMAFVRKLLSIGHGGVGWCGRIARQNGKPLLLLADSPNLSSFVTVGDIFSKL